MKRIIAAVLLAILIASCTTPVNGHVQGKRFDPAHLIPNGKAISRLPDRYYLTVCNDTGRCTELRVPEESYNAVNVGDYLIDGVVQR